MLVVFHLKVVFVVSLGGARWGTAAGKRGPFRLDVAERRQPPAGGVALEIVEPQLHRAPRTGVDGIGKVVGGQGKRGVAVDLPGVAGIGEFPEHRRRVERWCAAGRVVDVAQRRSGDGEGTVGKGLCGNRGEPAVADGKTHGQPAEYGQCLRRVHAHDGRRLGTDEFGVERMGGFDELRSEAGDEAVVGCVPAGGSLGATE